MENKVYLYRFIDGDNMGEDYYIITKNNCKKLIKDIEQFFYDICDYEDKDELIEYLKEEKASKKLIEYVQKGEYSTDSCYEFEMDILAELDELVDFEAEEIYY